MEKQLDHLLESMDHIKKLLILALLRDGASQTELAKTLGVSQSFISKLFPSGIGKQTKKTR